LNADGNVWKKSLFLTALYSNAKYLEYTTYDNFREMSRVFYSKTDPNARKKNICVFRINSELEIDVAKLFLTSLEPDQKKPMKGVGKYDKGVFKMLRSMLNDTNEIFLTFIRQVITGDTDLKQLIKDNFGEYQWSFCVVSTVNIRSLINSDEYIIHDIYVE